MRKTVIILWAAALFAAGCSKPSSGSGSTIQGGPVFSNPSLGSALFGEGVSPENQILCDASYGPVSGAWLVGEFSQALAAEQARAGTTETAAEVGAWDCNKFSRQAANLAAVLWDKAPGRPRETAFAFGEFYYHPDGGATDHAINIAVERNSTNGLSVVYYEPQTLKTVTLSASEKQSGFVRF